MTNANPKHKTSRRARKKNQELKKLLFLGLAAILIATLSMLIFTRNQKDNSAISSEQQALLVRDDSPTRGPADARVTLVEFLDPECEACRAAYPIVEEILSDYEGRIRYVVRYFPGHYNSVLAASATEAAGEQGMYWQMQEILFAKQPEWGESGVSQINLILTYASELGLDMERFVDSLGNPEYPTKVNRDLQDALALGVRGTPTFFVNGQIVYGMNEETLRQLIGEALN